MYYNRIIPNTCRLKVKHYTELVFLTFADFSDLSFLTVSPCSVTRSYRPEGEDEADEAERAVLAWAAGGGVIPDLYSLPVI